LIQRPRPIPEFVTGEAARLVRKRLIQPLEKLILREALWIELDEERADDRVDPHLGDARTLQEFALHLGIERWLPL
jgi:hypothetical protein